MWPTLFGVPRLLQMMAIFRLFRSVKMYQDQRGGEKKTAYSVSIVFCARDKSALFFKKLGHFVKAELCCLAILTVVLPPFVRKMRAGDGLRDKAPQRPVKAKECCWRILRVVSVDDLHGRGEPAVEEIPDIISFYTPCIGPLRNQWCNRVVQDTVTGGSKVG
jgi:hypothetical protein